MQILLGAYETIVKINSKATNIEYIQYFISNYFSEVIIENNYISIPQSTKNHHNRIFLLKWLYALYAKKTNNHMPEFKQLLIQRQHKAIKIVFKKKIIYKISYQIDDDRMVDISINPKNFKIISQIKSYLQAKMVVKSTSLHVEIDTPKRKELLKELLKSRTLIDAPHIHVFNKKEMEEFLAYEEIKRDRESFIDEAYLTLGLMPNDDKKTVKKHYKLLARRYHPDMLDFKDDETVELCTKKFQHIVEAYEILKKAI